MNEFEPLRPWQIGVGAVLVIAAAAWLIVPLFFIGSM
jgi:hypothetical protein